MIANTAAKSTDRLFIDPPLVFQQSAVKDARLLPENLAVLRRSPLYWIPTESARI
jgi:hypothetical protein